ncbi:hypothetical protein OAN61_00255 [bacterium]|nr:hypothetical protein [bacterium]
MERGQGEGLVENVEGMSPRVQDGRSNFMRELTGMVSAVKGALLQPRPQPAQEDKTLEMTTLRWTTLIEDGWISPKDRLLLTEPDPQRPGERTLLRTVMVLLSDPSKSNLATLEGELKAMAERIRKHKETQEKLDSFNWKQELVELHMKEQDEDSERVEQRQADQAMGYLKFETQEQRVEYETQREREKEARKLFRSARKELIKQGPEWADSPAMKELTKNLKIATERTDTMYFAAKYGAGARDLRRFGLSWEKVEPGIRKRMIEYADHRTKMHKIRRRSSTRCREAL